MLVAARAAIDWRNAGIWCSRSLRSVKYAARLVPPLPGHPDHDPSPVTRFASAGRYCRRPGAGRRHGRVARCRHRRGDAAGDQLASRFPSAPGAQQPRISHVEDRGRTVAPAGDRGADGHRAHGCRRYSAGRQARPDDRAALGHGRAARHGAGRLAVQVDGDVGVSRRESRRDACLRPRRSHGDPARGGQGARRHAQRTARHGDVHLPAGRRGRPRR